MGAPRARGSMVADPAKDDAMDPELERALRSEARGMAEAYQEAVLEHAAPGSVLGLYFKGSALRPWDSRLDYVPELSDVDLHVRLASWDDGAHGLSSTRAASLVAARALSTFRARFPDAVHTPRPQLMVMNEIERLDGYVPSPEATVETLHGTPYPAGTRETYAGVAPLDRRHFLIDADFVRDEVPWKLIDRPGALAWRVVSILTWRVGPAGPAILTQLGVDPFDAWSMNRTSVARALEAHATRELAGAYRDFYRAGWDGFASGFGDAEPAIRALMAADTVFEEGRRVIGEAPGS